MNKNPVLHVSICYENCSSVVRKELQKQLANYSKTQDPCIPYADICIDTLHSQEEKRLQQEMLYDAVVTNEIIRTLTNAKQIYTFAVLLISLTLQQLYEDNVNCKSEDWMLISFTQSKENANIYNIGWSIGM
jgi:hypothetical protein